MKSTNNTIDTFLSQVGRRLNRRSLASTALWALLAASFAMLAIGLAYIANGYAVDRRWYLAAAVAAVLGTLIGWVARLADKEQSARFADRHFGLKDSLVSSLHFASQDRHDGFCELTQQQTAARVSGLDLSEIAWRPPSGPAWGAVGLAAVALLLALKSPSLAVQERRQQEELTLASSTAQFEELKELARRLNEQVNDPLERELLEPDKLRERVESLAATKDQKEALRQQAKLEKELNKQLAKLQQKKDEQLLEEVAEELKKARETAELSKDLKQKNYKKAAEDLRDLKPEDAKPLSEEEKQLAKLRAAAKRMAAAVRNRRGSNSPGKTGRSDRQGQSPGSNSSAQSGKSGKANGASGARGGELSQAIEGLESAVDQLSDSLQEALRDQKNSGKVSGKLQQKLNADKRAAMGELSKLAQHLQRMQLKRNAAARLSKLCQACQACQAGLCQTPGNTAAQPPGSASSGARRDQRDELVDNGRTNALQGVKGQGPSQTSVETADEGTGAAASAATAKQRSFERQVESYVNREDVPEEVRAGVKQYFEAIHQVEESP
ncbi:MAG: hypothetical protein KDA37_00090 [Planctomycetales bacterium]|nr:hypothetical protein [Planctomycetales bacterium]